ncbi:MAG: ribulose-phosphate 3-epimerase [Candidatus Aminicenantia bacterium]
MIIPSILSANFARIADSVKPLLEIGATTFHVDIMDGHFVPNLTFGPELVRVLKNEFGIILDVHLMVENPMEVLPWFYKAGADWLSFHVEATPHTHRLILDIKEKGKKAGLALNPSTPLELVYPVIDYVDFVLIMSVNPGFERQKFIPSVLNKIKNLKKYIEGIKSDSEIQVDGGIGPDNLKEVLGAGSSLIVAGSSIFRSNDPVSAYKLMIEIEEELLKK